MRPVTPPKRLAILTLIGAALGLLAGGAAWVLVNLIGLLTNIALFGRIAWNLPSFAELGRSPRLILAPMIGGFVVAIMARWAPMIRGHGIPEAMEAVLRKQSRIQPRAAIAKPLSAAIAIGTGGPFGAEGPIIVTGGALGSLLGQIIEVSPSERKILLASGAAAGMAATFGAPVASVILAIELLLFEFSTRAFIPLVVASALAGGVHSQLFDTGPLFAVPAHDFAGLGNLPLFALLGVACGLLAVLICKGLFFFEGVYRRLPIAEFWHPVIGAVGFGIVGLAMPRALGVGYDAINGVLIGNFALTTLAVLTAAKLLAWWIALASGTSGGTLAPILLISGAFGGLIGGVAQTLFPTAHISPGTFALVGMAATFGAATRATFTAIVFLFELTGDYQSILPLMLASVLAELVTAFLLDDSLMTEKLSRRGIRVHGDYQASVLATHTVGDVMTRTVRTLPATSTVAAAQAAFTQGPHSAYPLVDSESNCVGIVSRGDLLGQIAESDRPLLDIASRDLVTVAPDDLLVTALQQMVTEEIDHLPVTDASGQLVGICTRTDILRARGRQFAEERMQAGWLSPMLRQTNH